MPWIRRGVKCSKTRVILSGGTMKNACVSKRKRGPPLPNTQCGLSQIHKLGTGRWREGPPIDRKCLKFSYVFSFHHY